MNDKVYLKCVICNEMKARYRYLEESENEAELGNYSKVKQENEGQDKKIVFWKFVKKSHNDIAH